MTQRKRHADTILIGFQGRPTGATQPREYSCSTPPSSLEVRQSLAAAITLEETMAIASERESALLHCGMCDELEADINAQSSELDSRAWLGCRGMLGGSNV